MLLLIGAGGENYDRIYVLGGGGRRSIIFQRKMYLDRRTSIL